MERQYNFEMGIMVDNTPIPDPATWGYQVGDLDTAGNRDATGGLHRSYVATKINHEFSWNGLSWQMLNTILQAVNKPMFRLTAPEEGKSRKKSPSFYTSFAIICQENVTIAPPGILVPGNGKGMA
jgi:hypothetical protein